MAPLAAATRFRRFIPLILSLVMGLVAIIMMQQYLTQERQKLVKEREQLLANYRQPIEVVVAAKDLTEGTTIEPVYLKALKIPEKFVQPYAVQPPGQELVGMVTVAPIAAGEQILLNKIRRPTDAPIEATLSSLTPKGKRAVTIGVDALTGVGGFVRPGDVVDILWSVPLPEQQGGAVTLTLFQGVSVLAVGSQMVGRPSTEQEPSQNYTVTLALAPEEASVLLYARQQGGIQLSLRSRADKGEQIQMAPVNYLKVLQSVLGTEAVPEPEPPKPAHTVEVYKGLERSVVSISD